ncbi:MAG: hypothetical protein JWO67_755 [Streptosporangiaceae bacterium]|nr:hypothetical protein [Streptosporangiaceae bacterium]
MPVIRYIYPPDIREHGDQPIVMEGVEARTLIEMRRAVPVSEDELAQLKKPQLVEIADQIGADVSPRDLKDHVVTAITEAQEPE